LSLRLEHPVVRRGWIVGEVTVEVVHDDEEALAGVSAEPGERGVGRLAGIAPGRVRRVAGMEIVNFEAAFDAGRRIAEDEVDEGRRTKAGRAQALAERDDLPPYRVDPIPTPCRPVDVRQLAGQDRRDGGERPWSLCARGCKSLALGGQPVE